MSFIFDKVQQSVQSKVEVLSFRLNLFKLCMEFIVLFTSPFPEWQSHYSNTSCT